MELRRLEVIHKVMERRINQKEASEILSLSSRQIRRLCKKIKLYGDIVIVHSSRGRLSRRRFSDEFKEKVMVIVKDKYYDFGPKFA